MTKKLSREDWVKAGLKTLAKDGFTAVRADLLAKSLAVSRGSFYWHFENLEAYHLALMQRWQALATDAVIKRVQNGPGGAGRLRALMRLAFEASPALEIGMRAWSASYDPARIFVDSVDRLRLNYLEELLRRQGMTARAPALAKIIYWTYLGSLQARTKASEAVLNAILNELGNFARGP